MQENAIISPEIYSLVHFDQTRATTSVYFYLRIPFLIPGIVNRTQSNSIRGLNSIEIEHQSFSEFDFRRNRTQSIWLCSI